ncbi:MAG: hypothetical protein ACREQ7_03895 [Candidatus Binatia bacterium]
MRKFLTLDFPATRRIRNGTLTIQEGIDTLLTAPYGYLFSPIQPSHHALAPLELILALYNQKKLEWTEQTSGGLVFGT